jgi:hypothetical protein
VVSLPWFASAMALAQSPLAPAAKAFWKSTWSAGESTRIVLGRAPGMPVAGGGGGKGAARRGDFGGAMSTRALWARAVTETSRPATSAIGLKAICPSAMAGDTCSFRQFSLDGERSIRP